MDTNSSILPFKIGQIMEVQIQFGPRLVYQASCDQQGDSVVGIEVTRQKALETGENTCFVKRFQIIIKPGSS